MNTAHLIYFWSLPIEPIRSKHEVVMGRTEPDWLVRAVAGVNIVGCYAAMGIFFVTHLDSQAAYMTLSELLGTLSWAMLAGFVVSPVKPPAPNPDAQSKSN